MKAWVWQLIEFASGRDAFATFVGRPRRGRRLITPFVGACSKGLNLGKVAMALRG
jgi:hypothetical protein